MALVTGLGRFSRRRCAAVIALLARSLHVRRSRTYLAVVGIGTSTLLVIILAGAFRSVRMAMVGYAGQSSVDLWVAPPGSDNLIRGSFAAQLPLELVDSIRGLVGVALADPLLKGFLPVYLPGTENPDRVVTLLAIGYEAPDGLGGPPAFAEGVAPRQRKEIALDRAAAFRIGAAVGDSVVLGRIKVEVSGLTTATNIVATQFVFGDLEAVADGLGSRREASLILVQLEATAVRDRVVRKLEERFPSVNVYPRDMFVRANEREVIAGFLPLLTLVAALGAGAACVLVGLLVLSVVDERRGEIAVLMAVGLRLGRIAQGVVAYVAQLLGLGIAIGLASAYGLTFVLDQLLPTIPLSLSASDASIVAVVFSLAGIGAAVVPVMQLGKVDPLEAFRP